MTKFKKYFLVFLKIAISFGLLYWLINNVGALLIPLALLVVPFIGLFYVDGFHYMTGNGSHLGYISSTQTHGIFYKTPRVYFKTSLRSSQEDKYCVANMALYEKLGSLTNENVEIQYVSYLANGITHCAGEKDVVTGFKIITKGKE